MVRMTVRDVASVLGAEFAEDAYESAKEALVEETAKGLIRLAKLSVADRVYLRDLVSGMFDEMYSARPDPRYGLSPQGLINAIMVSLYGTAHVSILLGEEVGEELFMELIQEGISNAFQTTLGGTLQTTMNVYRGGMPISVDDLVNLPSIIDFMDDLIAAFVVANAGANYLSTLFYLVYGAYNNVQQNYINVITQLQYSFTRLFDEYTWHLRQLIDIKREEIMSYIDRYVRLADSYTLYLIDMIEVALARINDMINELDTAYHNYQNGIITSEDVFIGIANSIDDTLTNLINNINEDYNKVVEVFNNIEFNIPDSVINEYRELLKRYAGLYNNIIEMVRVSYANELDNAFRRIDKYMEILWGYRSFYESGWEEYKPKPITLDSRRYKSVMMEARIK